MKLACAITLALVGLMSGSIPIQARIAKPVTSTTIPVQHPPSRKNIPVSFVPPPPPDQEAPSGRARGGASRGSCDNHQDKKRLTALVPVTSKSVWGLTVTEYPTFWFYVPDALTPEIPIEFVLQDEEDNYVYKTTFTVPGTQPGIVSLSLSSMKAPLEIGKKYYWTFSIDCDPQEPSNSIFVKGTVQRVAMNPALMSQVKAATQRDRIALYAANGIWHEALTTLAELRRTEPGDATLAATWENLLQYVDLQDIAKEPIVQCCTPRREGEMGNSGVLRSGA
jgi:hypothetical protein